jgi:hypothetical protein
MSKSICVPVLIVAALLLTASATFGSEADELREKAAKAKQEAAELQKQGRGEESEKAARKATELLQAAGKTEGERSIILRKEMEKRQAELKKMVENERRLKESHASDIQIAYIRDEIARMQRLVQSLANLAKQEEGADAAEQHKREMAGRMEEAGRHIEHLRIAADHLREAGTQDLAAQAIERAERIEREAYQAQEHRAAAAEHRERIEQGGLPAQLEELRREVGRLREEMKQLGQHVKELERQRK